MKRLIKALLVLLSLPFLPLFIVAMVVAALFARLTTDHDRPPRLVWGPEPLINNKYWSRALARGGFDSKTFMYRYYPSINQPGDFDMYLHQVLRLPRVALHFHASSYLAFLYAMIRFDVFHVSVLGGLLGRTLLWRLEAPLLHLAGKRIAVIPFGGDAYRYSQIIDPVLRHGLLLSYPAMAKEEPRIARRQTYWNRHADFMMVGCMLDGAGRWDLPTPSFLTIDVEHWSAKSSYSRHDGRSGPVKIMHTPNHRGFKGTEFLLEAVRALREEEGLLIELILLEKTPNEEVRRLMREEADLLAEQFIATAYAMSGIEGMASGLPVMANLEHESYTRLYRRFSFLDECPIVSTSPETMRDNLRRLVTDPALRETLGRAGRAYAEKYHSDETARYMFGAVYERIWHGKDVDLMNMFHPLKSAYNGQRPRIETPLVENRLPPQDVSAR